VNVAVLVQELVDAGATPQVIAIAVRAIEAAAADADAMRAVNAKRQARFRSRYNNVTRNVIITANSPPKKEPFPPTPPLQEKTTPHDGNADAFPVNGHAVDLLGLVKPKDENKDSLKAFGEAWNKLAASFSLPQIDEIKPGSRRERQALARLREMSHHDELIARIRGSPYLRGEVNGFRCSFDWVVNAANFQKIMEGNYESRKEPQRYAHRSH
jgi:hypothetical protein